MAPNSEEGGRIGALRWEEDTLAKVSFSFNIYLNSYLDNYDVFWY